MVFSRSLLTRCDRTEYVRNAESKRENSEIKTSILAEKFLSRFPLFVRQRANLLRPGRSITRERTKSLYAVPTVKLSTLLRTAKYGDTPDQQPQGGSAAPLCGKPSAFRADR